MDGPLLVRAAVVVLAAVLLRYTLWRAVLFARPASVRVDPDEPPREWDGQQWGLLPLPLRPRAAELFALGFAPQGTHIEAAWLGPTRTCFDLVHEEAGVYASLYEGASGRARMYLLSAREGRFVLTADYRRPAKEAPGRYLSGYLEGASAERILRAHLRRSAELAAGLAAGCNSALEARVAAQRAWYAGPGRAEVRARNARGLLWTAGTLGMVAWAVLGEL